MRTPIITEIQRFCLHDGPGIRTTIFVKGCPLHCPWCHNPENIDCKQEFYFHANKCIGCGRCTAACPSGACNIGNDNGAGKAATDTAHCTSCLQCVSACRSGARETVGKPISMESILQEALSDRIFYQHSGGGVTISGGEPLLYPEFTHDLAHRLKVENVHVAIESSLFAAWHNIAPLLQYVDLFVVDVKSLNPEKHQQVIGGSVPQILSNLERLLEARATVRIHLPIIPGFNDTSRDFETYAEYLGQFADSLSGVDILPYHSYATVKYTQLGRNYQYLGVPDLSRQHLAPLANALRERGIGEITIGGMVGTSPAAGNLVGHRPFDPRRDHLPRPAHLPTDKGVIATQR